jgi:hypothetical protein
MNKARFSQWMLIGLLFVLTACQAAGQPLSAAMSGSGDAVNGIRLEKGAADAAPLWAFCSGAQENTHIRTFHCRAPVWQTLAIGHLFLLADAALLNQDGSDLVWELAIDDYVVDLSSFGTFAYVMPAMPASPSPVREVFARVTDWNLVMTNLNPGEHTLSFRAQSETQSYLWLVQLVIEETDVTNISSVPFSLKS